MTDINDLVYQTSLVEGTGNAALTSVAGYSTFASAFPSSSSSQRFYYCIRHQFQSEHEIGEGYISAGELVRHTVLKSSNSDNLVNFSAGTKDIVNDVPASVQASLTVGAASSTDEAIALFDGTDGKKIKESPVTIDVNGNVSGVLTVNNVEIVDPGKAAYLIFNSGTKLTIVDDAEVSGSNTGDQLIFSKISVSGQSDVVADTTSDTLTLAAGTNLTITTDSGTDTITINAATQGNVSNEVDAKVIDNTVARFDGTTGKLIQKSNVTIDDGDNMIIPDQLVVGPESVGLTDAQLFVGVESDKDKGLVVRMIGGSGEAAFEIQDENELPKAKFSTSGNGALVLNYSGTMAPATYPGFVLSVQNIGDAGEGSWIEILNSGGANTGAFFGMAGDQFQLFNWQGGDIEFWTHPSPSDGRARFIMDKNGNFGVEGGNSFVWSHGWGGGKGILALGNAQTVPSSTLTNAVALYAESGLLQAMDADGTKTRLGTRVVTLTDGATPALNAALGNVFSLTAAGDRTIAVPTNPRAGQRITIRHTASGANRTLALNTGTGGFRFGTTITGLTITTSGLTDYIDCIYNATANKWDVISYVKGY